MIRNIKGLSLALAAVFAVGAVWASSAFAVEAKFMTAGEVYPVSITGNQLASHSFTTNAGTITCTTATFTGSATAASATQDVEAAYSGCTFLKIINVKVEMKGCKYRFHAGESVVTGESSGSVDVVSKTGKNCETEPITFSAGSLCTVTVGPQTGLKTVKFITKATTPQTIEVVPNVTGIKYTQVSGSACAHETTANGVYNPGRTSVKASNEAGEQVGVLVQP
jgi:hypothetical protein